jgi:ABC-type multidrug transport system fused ATPase/permease subunit
MLVLCVTTAASLITPLIVRRLVDDFDANSLDLLNQYFWVALVIAVFQATANALRFFLLGRLAEQIVVDIRKAVFDRVITMSPAFYEKIMTGEVVSRITTDTTLVQSIMGSIISMLLRNVLVLGGGACSAVYDLCQTDHYAVLGCAIYDPASASFGTKNASGQPGSARLDRSIKRQCIRTFGRGANRSILYP